MKVDILKAYVIRQEVMKLLSAEETAAIGAAGGAPGLREGQEYLDLDRAVVGVRWAVGNSPPHGRVLPRDAVRGDTWSKILNLISDAPRRDE
jgi:hypothetical protein